MLFSSVLFLFRFLPVVFVVYYLLPGRWKNFWLLVSSLIFYAWGEPRYFPIMMASILVNYAAARLMARWRRRPALRSAAFWVSFVFTIGWLLFFKYTDFFIANWNALTGMQVPPLFAGKMTLPLGISFYTFQILSYTIDVYLGKVEAERSFVDFGTFVTLFPQLIAGPIVTYTDVRRELHRRTVTAEMLGDGVRLFILGLGSKVLLANNIGALWDTVAAHGFTEASSALCWMALAAFAFQIYFDFSGYSLMAIGLGKALGFQFPKNFDYPYISRSVTEFWRRWHMTLSSWFREYVYIPLGGNRRGRLRQVFNIFVVWFLTGFWHGASWLFVLWGLYYGMLLMLEKLFLLRWLEKSQILSRVYLIGCVLFGWAIFGVGMLGGGSLRTLGELLGQMFASAGGSDWIYYLRSYGGVLALCAFFSTPALRWMYNRLQRYRWIVAGFLALVLVVSVAYLVDATYNPFLYFNF